MGFQDMCLKGDLNTMYSHEADIKITLEIIRRCIILSKPEVDYWFFFVHIARYCFIYMHTLNYFKDMK